MNDGKLNSNSYQNLGGVNEKSSEYSLTRAQFFNLRNVDFQVPNALQKRPGSTQAVSAGTSGPIRSLFEFEKLDGSSYVVAASDTALFYLAATNYTLLSSGWNNGQPPDMLTFVNKLWVANGQKFQWWNGTTMLPVGLPCPGGSMFVTRGETGTTASYMLVGGATMISQPTGGGTFFARGVFVAHSYFREDGYFGPLDMLRSAKNVVRGSAPSGAAGAEFFDHQFTTELGGLTIPSGRGISGIAIWVGVDSIEQSSSREDIAEVGNAQVGDLGWLTVRGSGFRFLSVTLKPTADLNRFWLWTTIPGASLYLANNGSATYYAATFFLNAASGAAFNTYTGIASSALGFTGLNFCWFDTHVPKYIEVNQNVMTSSGFSHSPSTIWVHDVGEPESIQSENNFEVRTNDGDLIRAHKAHNNQVIVMKERSFHKIIGDNPDNYELVELSTEYGCLSNKTVVEYREKLLWLDRLGVLEFNGSTWDIISTPVEDTFRRMNLSAAREYACAVHYPYRNQVWFGIPVDGATQNNITVVYDYLVGAWTFFDGFNVASMALVKSGLNNPTVWRGDYSGMVHYFGESFYGDNGAGITCLGFTRFDKEKENETWLWRRWFMDVAPVDGLTGVINGQVFANYNRSTIQATFSMYQDQFQSRADFGVPGKAAAIQFSHHSASLPFLMNGYSWSKRFLRNV